MLLSDLYKKAKKKIGETLTPTVQNTKTKLGTMADNFRRWGNNPANTPNWLNKVDAGLRSFSSSAENVPKFNFADKVKNPVGRFGAEMAQGIANIPSRAVSATFKDYGKVNTTPSYLLKRGAEAANIGLDAGSLFAGGSTAKQLAKTGFQKAGRTTLGKIFKQGAKRGAKEGFLYGGTSGALTGMQEGDNVKDQLKNATKEGLKGGAMGVAVGSVLGGAIPAAGHEVGSVKKDIKNFMNPYAKRVVTTAQFEKIGHYDPTGKTNFTRAIPGTERKFVETIKLPFKPQSATGKLLTARPGMNIEDVNMGKPKVVSSKELDAQIAQKRARAKALINKQISNQKAGLDNAEAGFVAPKDVPVPEKKKIYRVRMNKSEQTTLPFADYEGRLSETKLKAIQHDSLFKSFPEFSKENFNNTEALVPMSDRVNKYREYVQNFKNKQQILENNKRAVVRQVNNKSTAFDVPDGGYNKFQQRAFDKKAERVEALQEVLNYPNELRKIGYKKSEINRIGKDQADRIIKLGNLGYPKNEIQKYDLDRMDLIIKNGVPWQSLKKYYDRKHALDTHFLDDIDPAGLKDINPLMAGGRDVYRNFEAAFGKNYPKIKAELLDPFDASKGKMFEEQSQLANELEENIVKKFGIKKGSKLSEYVQKWGEGKYIRSLEELDIPESVKQKINFQEIKSLASKTAKGDWRRMVMRKLEKFPEEKRQVILSQLQRSEPKNWQNVVEADRWFRNKYETLLANLNQVREENFPTHPLYPESTKIIPFRKDYYRHFKDNEGFAGLKNMFESPSSIDPALAATSDVTNPKTKWLSFAQRRKGEKTEFDAVGGYLDYLKNHAYAKHIDPFIQKFKGVDEEAKQGLPTGIFFHETRGLAEELGQKLDPIQQITDLSDQAKIKKILMDFDVSDAQSEWMSKELTGIGNYDKVKNFLKAKLAKNKKGTFDQIIPKAAAEGSENQENNFLVFIKNFSRDLAGKTNPIDRPFQENIFGRKALKVINWANSRFKANAVLGNLSSSLAQFFNIPQGFASAGVRNSTRGLGDSFAGIFKKNTPINKSSFIKERYFNDYSKFDEGVLNNTKKFAVWMTGIGDKIGTKFIWNSHYRKALKEGIPDPIKYADDWTRKMVAGRGIGEVPIVQKSKITQLVAPFQLEVANQWYALRDLAKNDPKKLVMAKKLLEFLVASYLMNRVVKEIRGSDVSFDPINAMAEAYGEFKKEDSKIKGAVKAGGRMAGELLSNIPGGQTVATMYPEFGDFMGKKVLPNRKDFFGEGDPTRFGTGGLPMFSAIKNPLTGVVLPYGGKQLEKAYSGGKALVKGYAENNSGKVMTPVEGTPGNVIKGLMFGKNSLNEVKDYFDNDQRPLSDKQGEKFRMLGNEYFDEVSAERAAQKEKDALKKGGSKSKAGQVSDGIYQFSNGKIYVKSLNKEFSDIEKAQFEIAKDEFKNSDNNFLEIGDKVFRKSKSGTVSVMGANEYKSSLYTAQMASKKKNKDLAGWLEIAEKHYDVLNQQMNDPTIDELDKVAIQNKIDTLSEQFAKYRGYGGFTKGKSGSTKKEKEYDNPNIDPTFLEVDAMRMLGGKRSAMAMAPTPRVRTGGIRKVSRKPKKIIRIRRRLPK